MQGHAELVNLGRGRGLGLLGNSVVLSLPLFSLGLWGLFPQGDSAPGSSKEPLLGAFFLALLWSSWRRDQSLIPIL